ncbi:MAG: hypothetical protein HY040_00745 [Planctomycetes bacterium]|nr:hypothetical protein [Planctomycetota bacterium]
MFQLIGKLTAAVVRQGHIEADASLRSLLEAEDPNRRSEFERQIDELAAQGQEPETVRKLRELTDLPWDGVYGLLNRWPSFTRAEKQRWVRRQIYRRAAKAVVKSEHGQID